MKSSSKLEKSVNSAEHRMNLRLPVDLGVELDVRYPRGVPRVKEHLTGHLENLSDEGVCVTVSRLASNTEQKLLQGKLTLDVEFKIPMPNHMVGTKGRVVWIKTRGKNKSLGVHLEHLDENSKKKILHYILNRLVESQF